MNNYKRTNSTIVEVLVTIAITAIMTVMIVGCNAVNNNPASSTGIVKAEAKVVVGSDGLTAEQRNIKTRLEEDNKPGAIKHLYVISAYSGQVVIYSTVREKVSSSGKRLSPYSVTSTDGQYVDSNFNGMPIVINGQQFYTSEVLQDDGTYGPSVEYIYWYDTRGIYHQHYIQGGQIVHISSQPLAVKSIIINMEIIGNSAEAAE